MMMMIQTSIRIPTRLLTTTTTTTTTTEIHGGANVVVVAVGGGGGGGSWTWSSNVGIHREVVVGHDVVVRNEPYS